VGRRRIAYTPYLDGFLVRLTAPEARPATLVLLWQIFVSAAATVELWHERARQRRQLASFNEFQLKDIGLSRADVEGEISRPFWRP